MLSAEGCTLALVDQAQEQAGLAAGGSLLVEAGQVIPAARTLHHLDHLARGQQDDSGWTFNWLAWSPAAAADWRGVRTVEAVSVLKVNGRL